MSWRVYVMPSCVPALAFPDRQRRPTERAALSGTSSCQSDAAVDELDGVVFNVQGRPLQAGGPPSPSFTGEEEQLRNHVQEMWEGTLSGTELSGSGFVAIGNHACLRSQERPRWGVPDA